MADTDDATQRLSEYSTRTNVNAMNIALVDQRLTITERRVEEYHSRLHAAEDRLLVLQTRQEIHDVQIQGLRKILVGNGDRETIPMDIQRMDQAIASILKVDSTKLQAEIDNVREWKEMIESRAWAIALLILGLIVSNVWQWIVP